MSDFITNAYHHAKNSVDETNLTVQTADHRKASKEIKERVENKLENLKKENIEPSNKLVKTFDEIQKNHDDILKRTEHGTSGTEAKNYCDKILQNQRTLEQDFNSEFQSQLNKNNVKEDVKQTVEDVKNVFRPS